LRARGAAEIVDQRKLHDWFKPADACNAVHLSLASTVLLSALLSVRVKETIESWDLPGSTAARATLYMVTKPLKTSFGGSMHAHSRARLLVAVHCELAGLFLAGATFQLAHGCTGQRECCWRKALAGRFLLLNERHAPPAELAVVSAVVRALHGGLPVPVVPEPLAPEPEAPPPMPVDDPAPAPAPALEVLPPPAGAGVPVVGGGGGAGAPPPAPAAAPAAANEEPLSACKQE